MTNKEEGDSAGEPEFAALLAVHIVNQVLDEAYVIVNAAADLGQPCRYLAMLKDLRNNNISNGAEDPNLHNTSGDCSDHVDNNMIQSSIHNNTITTSTPQKIIIENMKNTNENTFIGQGDEDMALRQTEFNTSTSMFINHLFDISEVEHIVICENTESSQKIRTEIEETLPEAMSMIMESLLSSAFSIAYGRSIEHEGDGETCPSSENSGYSFLTDAFTVELASVMGDVSYCLNNDVPYDLNASSSAIVTGIKEENEENFAIEQENGTEAKTNEMTRYENAYLTLNRDFDVCSEDDGEPILQDSTGMSMQEVDLITKEENSVKEDDEPEKTKSETFNAISAVSASSRKSLVQRCRTQGARLMACLRGWWRRKTPGKRKEARVPGSMRGMCPLSPDARRRATSLLDQRRLCSSPDPTQQVVWKFNTVNEALVNSSHWKNYTYDENPDENAVF